MTNKRELRAYLLSHGDIPDDLVDEHLSRLGARYFERFTEVEIRSHLLGLSDLTPDKPGEVLVRRLGDGRTDCTVLGFDYPHLFSLLTGILAALGFNILIGDVFTYLPAASHPSPSQRGPQRRRLSPDPLKRRRIVDYFSGEAASSVPFEVWSDQLSGTVVEVLKLLEAGDDDSAARAKRTVNEMVVRMLAGRKFSSKPILYPVQIDIDNSDPAVTSLKVISQDTVAFLYTLSSALSLHRISIESVRIRTLEGRVEDEIDFVDSRGDKIEDPGILSQIQLSVVLTKQFTYFLESAPDPYAALSRFGRLAEEVLLMSKEGQWVQLLSNPTILKELARLLGASDYLWEDFIRRHYEVVLPMLEQDGKDQDFSTPAELLGRSMDEALRGAIEPAEQRRRLNEFKDREIFLIDLDHIRGRLDYRSFAEKLTVLAEQVIGTAARLAYGHLARRHGIPRTVGGMEAQFSVLGLGKLGGAALGYASDVELLFVYSDNGATDGESPLDNAEFFDRLAKGVVQIIEAKQQGIFHIDLRLRPYGNQSPLACSLENFYRYYVKDGPAHSYERLALVRLRTVAGNAALGARVERLRDEIVYSSAAIDFDELRELRKKQFESKSSGEQLNAKFCPGGLVDLEYDVQMLQVMYGGGVSELRTPRVHQALLVLADLEILAPQEAKGLIEAYGFLRELINGLRMLRGSAEDLLLPPTDSQEFAHLARRMGYRRGGALDAAEELRLDFETHTAAVRAFAEKHFGRDSLPRPHAGSVADLVLSADPAEELRNRVLTEAGFSNPGRAYVNLRSLAGEGGSRKNAFARLAVLAVDILRNTPDPDMALNNLERYIRIVASAESRFNTLLSQPMRLEILLGIFSASQFLADTVIRHPGFMDWVTVPENLYETRKRNEMEEELRSFTLSGAGRKEWLKEVRRFRRREILRIGTRDMVLGVVTPVVTHELSILAEALVKECLSWIWRETAEEAGRADDLCVLENRLCIVAMGKLGGDELNYSSDIDLIAFFDDSTGIGPNDKKLYSGVVERLRADLSDHTEEGYAYRVDFRLRPYGRAGELVPSLSSLVDYYLNKASAWEVQALLKARPVAGNAALGEDLMARLKPVLLQERNRESVVGSIEKMRRAAIKQSAGFMGGGIDVKTAAGGIRDIEFLVQGLQLLYASERPGILTGNTLRGLDALVDAGLLPPEQGARLEGGYVFLRRVEHCLQIMEDLQVHDVPNEREALEPLAKRVLGKDCTAEAFLETLHACMEEVRESYIEILVEG